MRVYTRGGDKGTTSRLSGERISKADAVIEANGTVDELSAWLGAVRCCCGDDVLLGEDWATVEALLLEVQKDLLLLGAALSSNDSDAWPRTPDQVPRFEALIDAVLEETGPLDHFLIPGVTEADARIHQARAVARRAERRVVALQPGDTADRAVRYLNRFSDVLFSISVWHRHQRCLLRDEAE